MASLSTTLSVLLAVGAGVALIHLVSGVERRFRGNANAADLFDALVPGDTARYRDPVLIAFRWQARSRAQRDGCRFSIVCRQVRSMGPRNTVSRRCS